MRIASHRLERLEIVNQARIHAGLDHRGLCFSLHALREALRERAGAIIEVPVEGFGEVQALCRFQAKRVDVVNKQKETRKLLSSGDDAELGRLFDRIESIAPSIRQS